MNAPAISRLSRILEALKNVVLKPNPASFLTQIASPGMLGSLYIVRPAVMPRPYLAFLMKHEAQCCLYTGHVCIEFLTTNTPFVI
jgi:hypothetical protein